MLYESHKTNKVLTQDGEVEVKVHLQSTHTYNKTVMILYWLQKNARVYL